MEITKTMKAGSNGTKTFHKIYGDRLVCVRHRLDSENGRRLTTIELVVNERPVNQGFGRILQLENALPAIVTQAQVQPKPKPKPKPKEP